MELTAENVQSVMMDCLYEENEIVDGKTPEGAVLVEGIVTKFGFNPKRLEKHRQEIVEMLGQLPKAFKKSMGGGMSFLQACVREDGVQWAEHPTMEALFMLGQAIGKVQLCLPRDTWEVLPGGMPYYVVDL